MATKNNINVNLFNVNENNAPFVKIEYLDNDANENCALMMIDSCSEVSMLFENMTEHLCLKRVSVSVFTYCHKKTEQERRLAQFC